MSNILKNYLQTLKEKGVSKKKIKRAAELGVEQIQEVTDLSLWGEIVRVQNDGSTKNQTGGGKENKG